MFIFCYCSDNVDLTAMFGSNNPSDNSVVVKVRRAIQVWMSRSLAGFIIFTM